MFCQNCGTKNDDASVFCQECGTKLEKIETIDLENSLVNEATKDPEFNNNVKVAKPIPKIYFVIAAELVAIVALCIFAKSNAEKCFDPKRIAGNYFANIVNGDYEAAYDMLDIPNDVFLSKELFVQSMKQKTFGDISQYQVSDNIGSAIDWFSNEVVDSDLDLGNTYFVTYRTTGGSYDDYYEVNLTKSDSKKLLFFDDWNVVSSSTWRKDVPIYVPSGSKVLVDEIDISIYKGSTNENGQDIYTIPYLFNGKHKINITSDDMIPVEDKFDAGNGYDLYSFSYTTDAVRSMQDTAVENIKKIYNAAASGKNYSEIKDLFNPENEQSEYCEEYYSELVEFFENSGITKIKFDSFNARSESSSNYIYVTISGTVDYSRTDWWGKTVREEADISNELEIGLIKKDGKWLQTNFGCRTFYY